MLCTRLTWKFNAKHIWLQSHVLSWQANNYNHQVRVYVFNGCFPISHWNPLPKLFVQTGHKVGKFCIMQPYAPNCSEGCIFLIVPHVSLAFAIHALFIFTANLANGRSYMLWVCNLHICSVQKHSVICKLPQWYEIYAILCCNCLDNTINVTPKHH